MADLLAGFHSALVHGPRERPEKRPWTARWTQPAGIARGEPCQARFPHRQKGW